MMKQFIFLLFGLCAISATINAQEQDLCLLLDIAYNSDSVMTKNSWLLENKTYFNVQPYSFKNNKVKKIILSKKGLKIDFDNGFYWNTKHNLKPGMEILDTPKIYLYKDTIYIVNELMEIGKMKPHKGWFAFGPSYYTIFTYNHNVNKWCYSYSRCPELQSRTFNREFDQIIEKCYYKAIDFCIKSGCETNSIYLIEDYFPEIQINNKNYIIPHVPIGRKISKYKKIADCFIGFPKVLFNENTVTVSIRIISPKQIATIENHLDETSAVSVKYDWISQRYLE